LFTGYRDSANSYQPFSAREALGQSWLKDLDAGAYFHESYIAHLGTSCFRRKIAVLTGPPDVPGDDAVSILSNNRLLFVQLRKLRVIWQVPLEELQSLSLEQSGIALILRGGTPGPFLPIGEQTGREWFFKNIGKCVGRLQSDGMDIETDCAAQDCDGVQQTSRAEG